MHMQTLLAVLMVPVAVLTAPVAFSDPFEAADPFMALLLARQAGGLQAPTPCKHISPPPSEAEMKGRHDKFVQAFLVDKDIVAAFTYIGSTYIVWSFCLLKKWLVEAN